MSELSITPRIMYQRTEQDGSPYAYNYAENLTQREVFDLSTGGTDKWYLASLTINYTAPYGTFVSSTAYFDRHTFETEDDTDFVSYAFGPLPAPVPGPITRKLDLRRFAQESLAAAALNHPNILSIYDIGDDGHTVYIAMELVDGKPLDEVLAAGPMPAMASPRVCGLSATLFTQQSNDPSWLGINAAKHLGA